VARPAPARCAALLLAALLAAGCASAAPATGPSAERPVYKVGAQWLRTDGAFELVRIDNGRYVFSAGPGREIHLTPNLGIALIRDDPYYNQMDTPLEFTWPMRVGQSGSGYTNWRWAQKPEGVPGYVMRWNVLAYEEVRVPAGAFNAFRIELTAETPSRSWTRTMTIWYAPDARQFVKWDAGGPGMFPLYRFNLVAVDPANRPALALSLAEPADQSRATDSAARLRGKVEGGVGTVSLRIPRKGGVVAPPPAGAGAELDVPVTLRPGKNVLVVSARDGGGETREVARTIFLDRPAPAPAPSTLPPPPVAASPGGTAPPVPPSAPRPAGVQVEIQAPPDQHRSDAAVITLKGRVSAGRGVAALAVAVNGTEVLSRDGGGAPSVPLEAPLTLREGINVIVVTARDRAGQASQEIRTIQHEQVKPLAVAVRYPPEGARVTDEASLVAAVVASSKGVARVTVSLNGATVHDEADRVVPKSVLVTVPLKLRDGPNAIVLTATEPDGTSRRESRTVIFDRPATPPPPPGAAPAPGAPRVAPERWAVVIGVGRYEHPGVTPLRYAVPDAQAVHDVLTTVGGFTRDHVLLLTDQTERKPTLRNIRWALGTFLARSARKDDTVLIFFAGHGAPEVDQRGLERDGLAKYLVPIDADPDDLFSSALAMDDIQTIFGRIEAERVVMFLDSCYSGAAAVGGRTFAPKQTRALNVDDLFLERLTRSKGRAIITASRPNEVSVELPELGHGLFTYFLVEGLRGKADLNRDGIVALQELYEYLEQQVTQKSRAVGGNQHPIMKGELEGVLPLVKVGDR
jgi:hypothetical protein